MKCSVAPEHVVWICLPYRPGREGWGSGYYGCAHNSTLGGAGASVLQLLHRGATGPFGPGAQRPASCVTAAPAGAQGLPAALAAAAGATEAPPAARASAALALKHVVAADSATREALAGAAPQVALPVPVTLAGARWSARPLTQPLLLSAGWLQHVPRSRFTSLHGTEADPLRSLRNETCLVAAYMVSENTESLSCETNRAFARH